MKRTFKNILYLFTWIVYFFFYNSDYYSIFSNYVESHVNYSSIVLSYLTALIWVFTFLWLINLVNKHIEKIYSKVFKHNYKFLFLWEFLVKIISITKYVVAFYIVSYLAILPDTLDVIANKLYSIAILVIFLFFSSSFVNTFFNTI